MFNSKSILLYLLLLATFAFTSCQSDDPKPENDGEVITDVILSFQELDLSGNPTGAITTFKASDPQGIEVGSTPTIDNVTLTTGRIYQMRIEVRNSIANTDITPEILKEADEHQFYFLGTAFVGTNVLTYTYADPSGDLLGLVGKVMVARSPGFNNANMRIVLRHALDKNFPGATNPNFEDFIQAGGETDLDITFPLILE